MHETKCALKFTTYWILSLDKTSSEANPTFGHANANFFVPKWLRYWIKLLSL